MQKVVHLMLLNLIFTSYKWKPLIVTTIMMNSLWFFIYWSPVRCMIYKWLWFMIYEVLFVIYITVSCTLAILPTVLVWSYKSKCRHQPTRSPFFLRVSCRWECSIEFKFVVSFSLILKSVVPLLESCWTVWIDKHRFHFLVKTDSHPPQSVGDLRGNS